MSEHQIDIGVLKRVYDALYECPKHSEVFLLLHRELFGDADVEYHGGVLEFQARLKMNEGFWS